SRRMCSRCFRPVQVLTGRRQSEFELPITEISSELRMEFRPQALPAVDGHLPEPQNKQGAQGYPVAEPSDVQRRLVAVFAADVEGYSRLMGADEVGTLKGLTERRAVLDKAIADHRGRIANTAGDSVLAEFGSAVDAIQCAVEAQAALAEANAGLATDKRI